MTDRRTFVALAGGALLGLPPNLQGAHVKCLGGDEGLAGLQAAYGAKLGRLDEIKAKHDPTHLFRLNRNIAPAPSADAPAMD